MNDIDDVILRMRLLAEEHAPDGWPAVQMRDITALLNDIESWQKQANDRTGDALQFVKERDEALAENATLRAEIDRLREDCAEAYQVIGAAMLGEPVTYTEDDVERALDNLSAAANGTQRPHVDLLPWPKTT